MFDWLPSSFDLKFWANFVATLVGVLFAWLAFGQARLAKELAAEAGKTVKIQTITIELTEIVQRLDRLEYGLSFSEARDLWRHTRTI
jgi:hypothetical protein